MGTSSLSVVSATGLSVVNVELEEGLARTATMGGIRATSSSLGPSLSFAPPTSRGVADPDLVIFASGPGLDLTAQPLTPHGEEDQEEDDKDDDDDHRLSSGSSADGNKDMTGRT